LPCYPPNPELSCYKPNAKWNEKADTYLLIAKALQAAKKPMSAVEDKFKLAVDAARKGGDCKREEAILDDYGQYLDDWGFPDEKAKKLEEADTVRSRGDEDDAMDVDSEEQEQGCESPLAQVRSH
jgi:hypothetical protein